MKFRIDENLPGELMGDLRSLGHEAHSVKEEGIAGAPDRVLLSKVREESRVFLTMDKGIGDIRAYPPTNYKGIVLFRPGMTGRRYVLAFVRRHLSALLDMALDGRLVVVSKSGIRVRRGDEP